MKAVYIEWCDAITNENSWLSKSEAIEWAESKNWIVKHLGFIVKETDEYILIAGEIGGMTSEDPLLGNVTKIPKTWIKSRKDLKIK